MRVLVLGLVLILAALQYRLWVNPGSVHELWRLRQEIAAQRAENARLLERNQALQAEVLDLKNGLEAIEERARLELGMVKDGEVFYQIVKPEGPP
jgi:cell division protein FtsB